MNIYLSLYSLFISVSLFISIYLSISISLSLSIYIYIYIYIYTHCRVCVCIYIYIYIYTHIHTADMSQFVIVLSMLGCCISFCSYPSIYHLSLSAGVLYIYIHTYIYIYIYIYIHIWSILICSLAMYTYWSLSFPTCSYLSSCNQYFSQSFQHLSLSLVLFLYFNGISTFMGNLIPRLSL